MPSRTQAAVSAFSAARKQHVQAHLGDVLELALGGRIVDGGLGVIEEPEERVAVVDVVANRDG
jgi:hypothetical protein